MKKMMNWSFFYLIIGLLSGVFYREFTKFNQFTQTTTLGFTHVHFLVLGTIVFMIVGLFVLLTNLDQQRYFSWFMRFYNVGLLLTGIMLYVRGIVQVLNISLTSGASAAISGMAGIGHIVLGVGFLFLLMSLRNVEKK